MALKEEKCKDDFFFFFFSAGRNTIHSLKFILKPDVVGKLWLNIKDS